MKMNVICGILLGLTSLVVHAAASESSSQDSLNQESISQGESTQLENAGQSPELAVTQPLEQEQVTSSADGVSTGLSAGPGYYPFFVTGKAGISPSAVLKVKTSPKTKINIVAQSAGPAIRADGKMTGMYLSYECVQYTLSINGVTFLTELMTPFSGNPYCPNAKSQIEIDLAALGASNLTTPLVIEIVEAKTNSMCRKLPIYNYHKDFEGSGTTSKTEFETRYCPVGEIDASAQVGFGLLVL